MSFEDFVNIGNEQEPMQESEYKELIQKFFSERKNIEFKTDLNDDELKEINRLMFLADMLDFKQLKSFVMKFMELRVSFKREGRKEFIYSIKPDYSQLPIQPLQSAILQQSGLQQPSDITRNPVKRFFGIKR